MIEDDKPDPRSDRLDESRQADGMSPPQRKSLWDRRRAKIREEIDRNRRGEYTVPTWVLVVALVVVVAGWAAIIILA